jgi:LmbE family N-acetylglucosaminyl deacetylase
MLTLGFGRTFRAPRRLLCLGAHSDDIEIGCGGAIMNLLAHNPDLRIYWVVFSAGPKRDEEARKSAALFLKRARRATVVVENFRDSFFPVMGQQIKEFFEELKVHFSPDLILTHYRHDLHQDHRTICELTWNTFRNHLILEYEIPKYDGDLGSPNVFFPLERKVCERKVRNILGSFKSQRGKQWFTRETFLALMKLRGVECNAPHGAAEAFYGRKLVL